MYITAIPKNTEGIERTMHTKACYQSHLNDTIFVRLHTTRAIDLHPYSASVQINNKLSLMTPVRHSGHVCLVSNHRTMQS